VLLGASPLMYNIVKLYFGLVVYIFSILFCYAFYFEGHRCVIACMKVVRTSKYLVL
jgi:hypothetical protein